MWLDRNQALLDQHSALVQATTLSELLNSLLLTKRGQDALYQVSRTNGGYDPTDGPLWVRPGDLARGLINGYVQVVGHTSVKSVTWAVDAGQHTGCIMCDCLHDGEKASKNEFLILEI